MWKPLLEWDKNGIVHRNITLGNFEVTLSIATGVENILDKIIFSSATLCSFSTDTALLTVLPVPMNKMKCANYIPNHWSNMINVIFPSNH